MKIISINNVFSTAKNNIFNNLNKNLFRHSWLDEPLGVQFNEEIRFWNNASLAEQVHTAGQIAINLRDNDQDIKTVFHTISKKVHIWIVDPEWNILSESKNYDLFLAESEEKGKKRKKKDNISICPVNMLKTSWILWKKSDVKDWERIYWELPFETSNKTSWILGIAITAIRNAIFKWDKHKLLFLCECRDISQIKLTEMAIAAEAEARKNQMTHMAWIFHDIKAPLWAILLDTHSIKEDGQLNEKQLNNIQNMQNSMKQIKEVIEWVLVHTKASEWKIEAYKTNFYLDEKLESIISIMQKNAENKWIWLRLEIEWEIPEIVNWDQTNLSRILINLISNAIKFTQHWEILLRVSYENWIAKLSVSDSWIWIEREKLNEIFVAFSQAQWWETSNKFWGTWLWLTISKSLAELLWGNISVESAVWKWSIFTVELPLDEVVINEAKVITESNQENRLMQITDEQREKYKPEYKILLAEDNTVMQHKMKRLLGNWWYPTLTANDWLEAMNLFNKWWIEFCILDGNMPNLKWWETTEQIRQKNKNIPIYSYSWSADRDQDWNWLLRSENEPLFEKAWVNWHFSKLIEPELIKEILQAHLDQFIRAKIQNTPEVNYAT